MNRGAALNLGGRGVVLRAEDARELTSGTFGWLELKETRHGPMLVNPRDIWVGRSLMLYGEYSEGEVELFRQVVPVGGVVAEVGANIGAHTVPLAKIVTDAGFVWAFEPQRLAFQNLCANLALGGVINAITFPIALGAAQASVKVPVLDPRREQNFGGLALGEHDEGESVPVGVLDAFRLQRLDLLKIDVEGMELDVLHGAAETILRCRPVIYMEADREEKSASLLTHVKALGYRAWWHMPPLFNPRNHAKNEDNQFGGTVSINVLCLPVGPGEGLDGENYLPGAEVVDPAESWSDAAKRLVRH